MLVRARLLDVLLATSVLLSRLFNDVLLDIGFGVLLKGDITAAFNINSESGHSCDRRERQGHREKYRRLFSYPATVNLAHLSSLSPHTCGQNSDYLAELTPPLAAFSSYIL